MVFYKAVVQSVIIVILESSGHRHVKHAGFRYEAGPIEKSELKRLRADVHSMDTDFCIEALEEALATYGSPEIFNTDQGAQFTSEVFTGVLKDAGIKISMDGKGRWVDNVFVERLWRSVKYEEVYLKAYETVPAARDGIGTYFKFYNSERRHQGLNRTTPDQV